ncbi:uncharacterized protein C8R40DRAFT_1263601 [Lentinula edodes]|uniref:uncharacterized protein n=1 Tax=Lentinula edodes TaxID=5353 RepID=UPI001E8E4917|nr:uncharacterized protein C8R40DRAFT_1263601 [Lentinula edodes]KAH7878372.1 hypothetical protein C8R40DRAFT_1263601 [Lentinula edodes]
MDHLIPSLIEQSAVVERLTSAFIFDNRGTSQEQYNPVQPPPGDKINVNAQKLVLKGLNNEPSQIRSSPSLSAVPISNLEFSSSKAGQYTGWALQALVLIRRLADIFTELLSGENTNKLNVQSTNDTFKNTTGGKVCVKVQSSIWVVHWSKNGSGAGPTP